MQQITLNSVLVAWILEMSLEVPFVSSMLCRWIPVRKKHHQFLHPRQHCLALSSMLWSKERMTLNGIQQHRLFISHECSSWALFVRGRVDRERVKISKDECRHTQREDKIPRWYWLAMSDIDLRSRWRTSNCSSQFRRQSNLYMNIWKFA